MRAPQSEDLTAMLQQWCSGDRSREPLLFEQLYPVLRAMAHKQIHARHGLTLQATDLAHDAFLRIFQHDKVDWKTRGQFFAIAATVVRRVVIDYLRERSAQKRGGDVEKFSLANITDSDAPIVERSDTDWLNLDRVLGELEAFDPQGARLVEMRYFMGMSISDIASSLDVSSSTIERQWRFAKAWLQQKLQTP